MRLTLLATTAVIAIAATAPFDHAMAETISTKKTAPIQTSTIKAGAPDAIDIAAAGSVELTGGTAVTMDSNNAVSNAGKILVNPASNANGGAGIVANAGTTGDIVNSGTITIDEPYVATDTDNDGDLDGPYALGSGRYGIRTLGDHTGKISNSGTISVEGNDSAGIALGGTLTGNFTHDGKTTVVGDRAVGIDARQINGNVRLAGTVTAQGKDAIGARFAGDVNGAMVVQGSIASTGYRNTTAPADASKLDADDLLQGGSALIIEGNVSGGIVLAVPPKNTSTTNPDVDGDGIEDAKEGSARVVTYGAAPAMVIGATDHAIAIGPVAGTASGFGLQIDGSIEGNGVYAGIDGNGLVIGGRGGAVTVANGIGVSGLVAASSNGGDATGLRLGSGASTPELRNSGTIGAVTTSVAGAEARALVIDAGASLPTIRNSGTIKAVAGENGSATAIVDRSGTVSLIENSGAISATGAKADSGRNIAIDLSTNSAGVTVRQTVVGSGFAAPTIVGDIRLGSGNDTVDLADGVLNGAIAFGGGNNTLTLSGDAGQAGNVTFGAGNDAMSLAGTSVYVGAVDFGGGIDSLTLSGTSIFQGSLANSAGLAVAVNGGTLDVRKPTAIASLAVGSGGVLVVTLDKTAGQGTAYTVAGTASFAQGAKLKLRLADIDTAVGNYTVLSAGTLQGAGNLTTDSTLVPFLFKATLATNAPANTIVVNVARRAASELGLNRSQTVAYDGVFAAIGKDSAVEGVFLNITEGKTFRQAVASMLPDHAGGAFEGVSQGVRSLTRQMLDPRGPIAYSGNLSVYTTANVWGTDKKEGDSAAYNLTGYAMSLIGEYQTGVGAFSVSGAYLWNRYTQNGLSTNRSDSFEVAAGWRGTWDTISAFARASIGKADFRNKRRFQGDNAGTAVDKTIQGKWNGTFTSLAGGISAEGGTVHFFYRPAVTVDYVRLKEDGYKDSGGGDALDLTVDGRRSSELGVNGGLTLGVDFYGTAKHDDNWLRLETEGGWREILSGGVGKTTARFKDGTAFTLEGEDPDGGWYARLRLFGGMSGLTLGGELGAEQRFDKVNMSLRGTMRVGF
ncbi:autotransporter domain-containing protein [Novosphingobium colocasiae]|uniref:autotransporter outer membrane beta-barrel domain-containing protein n=1 Tax=Novosphingobium colocasiae TaxID=1256513 RepID=UPI0035B3A757